MPPHERRPLRELLNGIEVASVRGSADVPVGRIRADSRAIEAGEVFVCLRGYRTEGGEVRADRHDFIPQALDRGAAALVVEREPTVPVPEGVTVVRVANCWSAIAKMACTYYDNPSQRLRMVGVTGTSGKTSTTYFIDAVLQAAGYRTGRIGTIDYRLGGQTRPAVQTTPEAPELQALLREAVDAGLDAIVMEVSSHALELRRVAEIAYDVAVFTNLSQDHLNFHPDMHHYLRAKGRLFEELASGGKDAVAVVNGDDPASPYIKRVNRGRLLTYGMASSADVVAEQIALHSRGARFVVNAPQATFPVEIKHLGDYSVHNALAAIAVGVALGLPIERIREGVAATPAVSGRFEMVDAGQDFVVVVDYAHKPGALERVLQSARALKPRRLICIFGCGGDRDRSKRPLMGEIAARLSDLVVVTSDNPRSENPSAIIDEIVAGIPPGAKEKVLVEADRAAAIAHALSEARTGDLVLIAGKGHETYQILGERRIHFDDRETARLALQRRGE